MRLHISRSNSKIGSCLNVSLPPDRTCMGRRCRTKCYARKGQCNTRECRAAWEENYQLWLNEPDSFERQLWDRLSRAKTRRFRWHVGGDIPDLDYLRMMALTAASFPEISFTCYTKAFYDRPEIFKKLIDSESWLIHPNLRIWLSIWEEFGYCGIAPGALPPGLHGLFHTVEPGEDPPRGALHCPGSCTSCQACWTAEPGSEIWIAKHR